MGSSNLFAIALLLLSTHKIIALSDQQWKKSKYAAWRRLRSSEGLLLGGGENLSVGGTVEGELVADISYVLLFLSFQDIYSGCCMGAAQNYLSRVRATCSGPGEVELCEGLLAAPCIVTL